MKKSLKRRYLDQLEREIERIEEMDVGCEHQQELGKVADLMMAIKSKDEKDVSVVDICRLIIDMTAVLAPLGVYVIYLNKGFIFEQTGVFSSKVFSNLINKIKP